MAADRCDGSLAPWNSHHIPEALRQLALQRYECCVRPSSRVSCTTSSTRCQTSRLRPSRTPRCRIQPTSYREGSRLQRISTSLLPTTDRRRMYAVQPPEPKNIPP